MGGEYAEGVFAVTEAYDPPRRQVGHGGPDADAAPRHGGRLPRGGPLRPGGSLLNGGHHPSPANEAFALA